MMLLNFLWCLSFHVMYKIKIKKNILTQLNFIGEGLIYICFVLLHLYGYGHSLISRYVCRVTWICKLSFILDVSKLTSVYQFPFRKSMYQFVLFFYEVLLTITPRTIVKVTKISNFTL